MPHVMAVAIAGFLGLYALLGVLVAVWLQIRGLERVDPAAAGGSVGFRILVFPGCVALWPLLLRRMMAGTGPPPEQNAHRQIAGRTAK